MKTFLDYEKLFLSQDYDKELERFLKSLPFKPSYVIKLLNISRATYHRKRKKSEFTINEMRTLIYEASKLG